MSVDHHRRAIFLSLTAYSIWVLGDASAKLASDTLGLIQMVAVHSTVAALVTFGIAVASGDLKKLIGKRRGLLFVNALLWGGSSIGAIGGVAMLPMVTFYAIVFTSPLIASALGSIFLGEKTGWKGWAATCLGFAGALLAVQDDGAAGPIPMLGVLLTLGAAIAFSCALLVVRMAKDESPTALGFWPYVLSVFVFSGVLLGSDAPFVLDPRGLSFSASGGFLGAIGSVVLNQSLRHAPASVVSPYHYSQIIGGAALGWAIWHAVPSLGAIAGSVMVTVSGLIILYANPDKPISLVDKI